MDIDFGNDIVVRFNFIVLFLDFEKGCYCIVSLFLFMGLVVEIKCLLNVIIGDIIIFIILEVMGLMKELIEIIYELDIIKYNKYLGKYEFFFIILLEIDFGLLN